MPENTETRYRNLGKKKYLANDTYSKTGEVKEKLYHIYRKSTTLRKSSVYCEEGNSACALKHATQSTWLSVIFYMEQYKPIWRITVYSTQDRNGTRAFHGVNTVENLDGLQMRNFIPL